MIPSWITSSLSSVFKAYHERLLLSWDVQTKVISKRKMIFSLDLALCVSGGQHNRYWCSIQMSGEAE